MTFLHAIVTKSHEDIALLEKVVSTLKNVQGASKSTSNLFKICDAYVRLAKNVVQRQLQVEASETPRIDLEMHHDNIRWTNDTGQSLFDPDILQSTLGQDAVFDGVHSSSALNILDDWMSGQPLPIDFFDMDLETDSLS